MDSIALATTISTLTGVCLKTAGALDALRPNFTNEERTIKSMYSECAAISASLTKTQSCILQDASPLDQIQLKEIFDVIITGCRVLFACLEQDLEKSSAEASANKSWMPWSSSKKVETEWDQKKMNGYLADMRMQQGALILLNELLLIKDPEQLRIKRQNNSSAVQQQEFSTRKLREANPGINIPASVYGTSATSRQPGKSVSATTYDQSFAFDNMLDNSEAYRRSMGIPPSAVSRSQASQPGPAPMDAKQEKEELAARDENGSNPLDNDELPEYTPYPDEPFQPNPASVDEYIPNPRAAFQSYGVPKPIPSDRIPATHVPSSPESLPLTATPSHITYTLPLKNKQHILVQLHNPNPSPVQYRIKTTAPKRYCVRPHHGTIAARDSTNIDFVAVPWSASTKKPERTDKFLVESMVVMLGENFDWVRDGERRAGEVQRAKIRVGLEGDA